METKREICRRPLQSRPQTSKPSCPVLFTRTGTAQRAYNIRVHVCRRIQKIIRTGETEESREVWERYGEELRDRNRLENMVKTEKKSLRLEKRIFTGWDVFSTDYFKWFFKSEGVKMLFKAEIRDIQEIDWTPGILCNLFKSKCCTEEVHTAYCRTVWTQFLDFLHNGLIEELEETPASTLKKPKIIEAAKIEQFAAIDESKMIAQIEPFAPIDEARMYAKIEPFALIDDTKMYTKIETSAPIDEEEHEADYYLACT